MIYTAACSSSFEIANWMRRTYFDSPDSPIPAYKLNQFGAALGGPVVLPGYNGKNRTFFFADYQGTRIRTGQTFLATVAPSAWKTGDFSGFNTILDPNTTVVNGSDVNRQPFPAIASLERFDPVSQS